ELSSVIDAAAIVRQFNKELLAFLASSSYVDKFYDKVRHFSFIRSQFGGYAMHDSLRKIMIDKLRIDTPQHYQELHQKAAQYYEQQLQRLEQENPDNIDDRQRFALERIYHLFQISEKQGILYFRQIFENYFSKRQFDFCQALLNELNNYQVTDKTQQWIQYYKGRMAIYMGETPGQPVGILKARNVLEKLNDDATLDRELRINVLENLASIYWYYSLQENTGTEKAERFYQECLKLRSATPDDAAGTARILIWLGILHQRTEGKGEQYFQKAKKLGVGIENVIAQAERELSISCRMQGRFRESQSLIRSSLETFDKLQLYYEKANSLMNYAKLLVDIGQINEAEAIFNQSIKIFQQGQPRFQERPWPLIGLADVALDRGDYRQALTYYNEIEMICQSYPEDKFWQAMITGGRAEIYCQQENWQLALNLANESLNLREEIEDKFGLGWILDTKGRALFGQGLYQEALDSFVEGLRHMEDYGSFFGQSKLSLSICQVHCYRNEIKEFRQAAERIEKLMTDYGYFGHLASLSFLKGVLCLKDLDRNDNLILKETACSQVVLNFTNALVNALKYNTHFLDSLLHKIINSLRPYETLALSNGNFLNQTIFKELTERWERETFDGYRLVVLERRKRSLEGGNGKNQLTILEIMQEKAFNGTYPNSM
ncbi:MAG: tetratricopeptide repeat protein, partial [Spirulina sp.]